MSAVATRTAQHRELDARTRRAWSAYSRRLRGLAGDEYESAEGESWEELQQELGRVDRRRRSLKRAP